MPIQHERICRSSALLAVINAADQDHARAKQAWFDLLAQREDPVSTNNVLLERLALLERRRGLEAVKMLQEEMAPVLRSEWVDETRHLAGVNALLSASRRQISLVDWVSFETMQRLGLKTVFAFDKHFAEQGFDLLPS